MDYLDAVRVIEGKPTQEVGRFAKDNRQVLEDALATQGAFLLRGFQQSETAVIEPVLSCLSTELLEDAFWSTPRSGVSGKTFTATEYPGARTISLHSEMAYMTTFPRLLGFHSVKVAEEGGETTIAELDAVSRDLSDVLDQFADGVVYQRHYHSGVDIPWQTAFRTEDRSEVGRIAKKAKMEIAWLDGDSLRTRHWAQGLAKAGDGRKLWFNQSHLFHSSNLSDNEKTTLSALFGEDKLPRDSFFADGSKIPDELVAHVHDVLKKNTIPVRWQPGDVLVIDNMRYMHGRLPYSGTRKLFVAMAVAQDNPQLSPLFQKKGLGAKLWWRLRG